MTATLPAQRGSDYAGLCRAMRASRLLERTPWRYVGRATLTLGFFAVCWWVTVLVGSSWFVLIPAGLLGLASTQIAFLGHDGGHQQIAGKRGGNTAVGLVAGNLLAGLSLGWWVDKHNRHHANPNKVDHDPDIGEGVLAFTTTQAEMHRGPVARAIVRNQAVLFFPLLLLEGINLHVASGLFLRAARPSASRRLETGLLTVHAIAYVGACFALLPPLHALAFIALHQAVFGFYMGCSFAPNHKGMQILAADETVDYLRRQVLTSRNVRGGWFVDQVLGGLNYQVEHHLFPSMPRSNLRRAQSLVREHCARCDVEYTETSLVDSYVIALRYLHALGEPLRTPEPGQRVPAEQPRTVGSEPV